MVFRESNMEDVLYLHNLFREEVFKNSSGDLFIKTRGKSGWTRLHVAQLERRGLVVCVRLRLLAAKQTFSATVFRRRRPGGFMIFWPVPILYRLFSMSSFSGWASKWVQHSHPRWASSFSKAFGYEAFVGSTHGNTSQNHLSSVSYTDRCLEQLSCCTPCYIWLLSLWAYASREQSGLTQAGARASAEELVRALLDVLKDLGPSDEYQLVIQVAAKWRSSWPLPAQEDCSVLGRATVALAHRASKAWSLGNCVGNFLGEAKARASS